jgi:hypothetical protein
MKKATDKIVTNKVPDSVTQAIEVPVFSQKIWDKFTDPQSLVTAVGVVDDVISKAVTIVKDKEVAIKIKPFSALHLLGTFNRVVDVITIKYEPHRTDSEYNDGVEPPAPNADGVATRKKLAALEPFVDIVQEDAISKRSDGSKSSSSMSKMEL